VNELRAGENVIAISPLAFLLSQSKNQPYQRSPFFAFRPLPETIWYVLKSRALVCIPKERVYLPVVAADAAVSAHHTHTLRPLRPYYSAPMRSSFYLRDPLEVKDFAVLGMPSLAL